MNQFLSDKDVTDLPALLEKVQRLKQTPFGDQALGKNKTLALLFFNSSLRTRMSTQRAAQNLGMNVITMNMTEGWGMEFEDGTVMNLDKAEHIREAAAVVSQYADIIGLRVFAGLKDRAHDYQEVLLRQFAKYATVPIINLESATVHPLQSFADYLTIEEHKKQARPKVVLTWAPHPRALPQAVANSFVAWMKRTDYELVITQPPGYELAEEFTAACTVTHDQNEAFKGADFIYAKNWSSYSDYGKIHTPKVDWQVTAQKMALTNDAFFMHCLPVRRNVVVADTVIDSPQSLVIPQAANRMYTAQVVLKELLSSMH
jgi:N-succinyl-L-ornithine transcarbamylase